MLDNVSLLGVSCQCCHSSNRYIPICVMLIAILTGFVSSMNGYGACRKERFEFPGHYFCNLSHSIPVIIFVLSCVSRNYQITHGANCPSASILEECRFLPSWHTRSFVLLKIVRTWKSRWDLSVWFYVSVSFAVAVLTLKRLFSCLRWPWWFVVSFYNSVEICDVNSSKAEYTAL